MKFDARKTHSCTTKVHSDVATWHDDNGTLVVTVPRASYTTAIQTDSIQLHRRLMHCSMSLPAEWICSVVATTNLALYKLSITPPMMSADFTFMLTIQLHDAWTLGIAIIMIIIIYSQKDGCEILWDHLVSLYYDDKGKRSGLAIAHKVKFEHLHLSSFAKMRVDLAAQASCH